jgi:hypothetical protein
MRGFLLRLRLRTKSDPVRRAAIKAAALPALGEARIDWDVANPFVAGVLEKTGAEIVSVGETTRLNVLRIIRDGYEQGLSIPTRRRRSARAWRRQRPRRANQCGGTALAS